MSLSVKKTGQIPFDAHVKLLQMFLSSRDEIVDKIQQLLNAQKKPVYYQQDFNLLSRSMKDCFFLIKGITHDQFSLRDQLETAHWASGFKPRVSPGNDLVDPAEMMIRGFHYWRETRWPGSNGRIRYAHTLFNLYLIRCLMLLTMRLWDTEADKVGDQLREIQVLLDQLWEGKPNDQPALIRDARWLIPVAMSPTTDELTGYFPVLAKISDTFSDEDLIESLRAAVVLGAGHLRSQLRHLSMQQGGALDEINLILDARKTNALDIAQLIQGLVPLLSAYESTCQSDDCRQRLHLASAICQGISPDPELFLNRLELLYPYSMIEHLFITTDSNGTAVYTAMGQRHLQTLCEYKVLINRVAKFLYDDFQNTKCVDGAYSTYGILYGFSSNLFELMAFKTLQLDAVIKFSLEDAFTDGDVDKLAWVNGWRKLPHIKPEVVKQYEYPQQFAEDIRTRIDQSLTQRLSAGETNAAVVGRIYIHYETDLKSAENFMQIPEIPLRYLLSSDPQVVAEEKAVAMDQKNLLACRLEGEFLVSYKTSNGWVAVSKDCLTEVLGAGEDLRLVGFPREAAEILNLMCPDRVVLHVS